MAISEVDLDSPGIRALGSRFKLTEVFLWDNGLSTEVEQASLFPQHIRFKYDSDDNDDDDPTRKSSNSSLENAEDNSTVTEDVELTQQMSALGLPLSFQTNKHNNGQTKVKTKATKSRNKLNPKGFEVQVKRSSTLGEENSPSVDTQEKSANSSSSLLHQTNLSYSGGDFFVEFGDELVCHAFEEHTHVIKKICDDSVEQDDIIADDILTEMPIDDPGSCDNIDNVSFSESTGDWSACWDTFYMRYYFYNSKTRESTWDPPPGMENLALVDYSRAFSGSNEELNGGNEEVPSFEKEPVDRSVLVSVTWSDDQPGGKTGLDRCPNLSLDECHDVFESKDLELNEIGIQNTAHSTKRKKTRKNRRRKKLSDDNIYNEVQLVQEFHIDITKYWNQRYLLFSKFDHGIKMDKEGWFSVTPEAIAKHHASRSGGGVVVDCFVGVGGNAIQFAKVSKQVIGIDIDSSKIDFAHHNAVIYGVEEKIDFVTGDCFTLATKLIADTVFLSPPWGGPHYSKLDSYNIDMLLPYDGRSLFDTFEAVASTIVMFLPRNVNIVQLAELCLNAETQWSLEVEKNFLNGKLKAVTAYYSKIS